MYRDRYPNRRHRLDKTVTRLAMNLRVFGAFNPSAGTANRPRSVFKANMDEVLRLVQENVDTSSRAIAERSKIKGTRPSFGFSEFCGIILASSNFIKHYKKPTILSA